MTDARKAHEAAVKTAVNACLDKLVADKPTAVLVGFHRDMLMAGLQGYFATLAQHDFKVMPRDATDAMCAAMPTSLPATNWECGWRAAPKFPPED